MATVMKISPQGQIRIPKKVLNALKIQPGDYVEVDMNNGHVILMPRKLIDPSQGWYWTKEWQEIENRIDQELKEKEHSPTFQTAEEGARWLDE
jgi:AbrB family looped-hinge helix DNA binding protein